MAALITPTSVHAVVADVVVVPVSGPGVPAGLPKSLRGDVVTLD
jgi:hypothetical protein